MQKFLDGTKVRWKNHKGKYREGYVLNYWKEYKGYGSGYEVLFLDDNTSVGLFQDDNLEFVSIIMNNFGKRLF